MRIDAGRGLGYDGTKGGERMSRRVKQVVDPETGRVVAERRSDLLGESVYSEPSEPWVRRAAGRLADVFAIVSTVLAAALLLLEEFSPYFAELALSDVGVIFVPGILIAARRGICAIKDAAERDERIRYAKSVGEEKTFRIVDPETGKAEAVTLLLVTDNVSYTEASEPELEPERSIERQKLDAMARASGNTVRRLRKERTYRVVDPDTGRTVASLHDAERILREEPPASRLALALSCAGLLCIALMFPCVLAMFLLPGDLKVYAGIALVAAFVLLQVFGIAVDIVNLRGEKRNSKPDDHEQQALL